MIVPRFRRRPTLEDLPTEVRFNICPYCFSSMTRILIRSISRPTFGYLSYCLSFCTEEHRESNGLCSFPSFVTGRKEYGCFSLDASLLRLSKLFRYECLDFLFEHYTIDFLHMHDISNFDWRFPGHMPRLRSVVLGSHQFRIKKPLASRMEAFRSIANLLVNLAELRFYCIFWEDDRNPDEMPRMEAAFREVDFFAKMSLKKVEVVYDPYPYKMSATESEDIQERIKQRILQGPSASEERAENV